MKLLGSTLLLTGAGGGIGRSLSEKLAEAGATLILVGRSGIELQQLADTLVGHHHVINADINSDDDRQVISQFLNDRGIVLDGVVQLAGLSEFACLEDTTEARLSLLMQTNLLSPILLTRQLMPYLNTDQATLLFVGSTLGAIGFPGYTGYCASKFGLRGFAEALERECSDTHVRVKYVAPRATNTAMNSDRVIRMNAALGNMMDDSSVVAECLFHSLQGQKSRVNIGWPERLLIPVNAIFTRLVSWVISHKTPLIKQFATEQS